MLRPLYFVLAFFLFIGHTTAQGPPGVQQLYQFPNGTRIQDVLVLRNESLLLTLLTEPSLYRLDNNSKTPVLVRRFPHRTSLLGIAQLPGHRTTIAVIAGSLTEASLTTGADIKGVPGSFSIILLSEKGDIIATFRIPQASTLRGLTSLPDAPKYLLASDTTLGVVWRLNTRTGAVDKAITDPISESDPPAFYDIQAQGQYLYFTAPRSLATGRIRIKPNGTLAGDPAELQFFDPSFEQFLQFTVESDGFIIATDQYYSGVCRVGPGGNAQEILNRDKVAFPTGVDLAPNRNVVYIVSAGSLPGVHPTGGGIETVDLSPTVGGTGGGQVLRLNLNSKSS